MWDTSIQKQRNKCIPTGAKTMFWHRLPIYDGIDLNILHPTRVEG